MAQLKGRVVDMPADNTVPHLNCLCFLCVCVACVATCKSTEPIRQTVAQGAVKISLQSVAMKSVLAKLDTISVKNNKMTGPTRITAERVAKTAEVLEQAYIFLEAAKSRYQTVWDGVPIAGQIWRQHLSACLLTYKKS